MTERIVVSDDHWEAIEAGVRQGHHPRTVMVEWWRLVLGMSVEEWEAIEPGGVSVMDYEVSVDDGARLADIITGMGKVGSMTWLDLGPRVAD